MNDSPPEETRPASAPATSGFDLNRPTIISLLYLTSFITGVTGIVGVVLEEGIDGMIVSNTTIARPDSLKSSNRSETGGLSGAPLFGPSTEILRKTYRLTGGRIPLIGVGGIESGAAAYAKIKAGASLVQLYTALIYKGPGLVRRIADELGTLLERDGCSSLAEAVGVDSGTAP